MPALENQIRPPQLAAADLVTDAHRVYDAVPRFPLLSDEECWRRMPRPLAGGRGPLPNWAKAVAVQAPRTAAAMLALDFAHRTQGPLDAALKAKLRWVVARANRCAYAMAYAAEDLRRAGADEAELRSLAALDFSLDADSLALEFAWELTGDAQAISDEQFRDLVAHYGQRSVAAMVLLIAYANFQDRLLLSLNLPVESVGPLAPLPVRFGPDAFSLQPPPQAPRGTQSLPDANGDAPLVENHEWSKLNYAALQSRLALQWQRTSRVRVPTWDEVRPNVPLDYPTEQPVSIAWALVCLGHVPELALPWNAAARMFWAELPQDRVYEASLFWIQTRVRQCSYCMGHCEMLLELAGLEPASITQRLQRLASGNWSCFPAEEQLAYAFACLLTQSPWEVSDADIDAVKSALGEQGAMAAIWWLCRGVYATSIASAFELPLERENVFRAPAEPSGSAPPREAVPLPPLKLPPKTARAWRT